MKNLSSDIDNIWDKISRHGIQTVSLDVDGTLYPLKALQRRWWRAFCFSPIKALRFARQKGLLEKQRKNEDELFAVDLTAFLTYHSQLLSPDLVPLEIRRFITDLKEKNLSLFFLSDHGTRAKLQKLELTTWGTPVSCLEESGVLKPHAKISHLLTETYAITPATHLHIGDRETDEEQTRLMRAHFHRLAP